MLSCLFYIDWGRWECKPSALSHAKNEGGDGNYILSKILLSASAVKCTPLVQRAAFEKQT